MTPVYAAAAHGAVIEDVDGNRFIDFTGGLGVLNAGLRRRPPRSRTRSTATSTPAHVMNEPYAVAEALNRITPATTSGPCW